MKMKKTTAWIAAAVLALGLCTGCSAKDYTLDTPAAGQTLLKQVEFADELEMASEITASLMYDLPDGAMIDLYMGNGSYADELAIITCQNAEQADRAKQAAMIHLQDVAMSFEDYIPEEAAKVEDALIRVKGRYVIVCVTADDTAADKIEAVLK